MATELVAATLRAQAKHWESEVATGQRLLAVHNAEVEARVKAIAELDTALNTLTRANDANLNTAIAFLRGQRGNAVNELATAQGQAGKARTDLDNCAKTATSFTSAADLLTPVEPVRAVARARGK